MKISKIFTFVIVVMLFSIVGCSTSKSPVDKLSLAMDDVCKIVKSNVGNPQAATLSLSNYLFSNVTTLVSLRNEIQNNAESIKDDANKLALAMKKLEPIVKKGMKLQMISVELKKDTNFAKVLAKFNSAAFGN